MSIIILLCGGGDLASGVALRLHRAGLRVLITELPQPLAVRRLVSFAEAVYTGETTVEGVTARRAVDLVDALNILQQGIIPVLVDPLTEALCPPQALRRAMSPMVFVDARMTKRPPNLTLDIAPLVIGLGPGFVPGENCHAVVETNRGHRMGCVLWQGLPEPDTGVPGAVGERLAERVLRSPAEGILHTRAEIGDHLEVGQIVAEAAGQPVVAPFRGVLRGLLRPGIPVIPGLKIGDLDPRDDSRICSLVSDKSLAVGGGVLEAILSRPDLRPHLWG